MVASLPSLSWRSTGHQGLIQADENLILLQALIYTEMAKPIELGLVLEGEDALEFHRYIKNPTDTPKGRQLIQEAYEESMHNSLK